MGHGKYSIFGLTARNKDLGLWECSVLVQEKISMLQKKLGLDARVIGFLCLDPRHGVHKVL